MERRVISVQAKLLVYFTGAILSLVFVACDASLRFTSKDPRVDTFFEFDTRDLRHLRQLVC